MMGSDYDDFLKLLFSFKPDCTRFLKIKTECDNNEAENVFIESLFILKKKKEAG